MVTSVNQRLLFLSFACYVVICVIPIFDLLIDGRKNKEAVVEMSYFSLLFSLLFEEIKNHYFSLEGGKGGGESIVSKPLSSLNGNRNACIKKTKHQNCNEKFNSTSQINEN